MTKTMTKISILAIAFFAALLLALSCTNAAFASNKYVMDEYGLLDSSTSSSMEATAQSLTDTYGIGTYLYICSDIDNQNARDYAKSVWSDKNLGIGSDDSGIMFLIAVDSRDYVTITHGDAINVFTDYGIYQIEESIVSYLKNNDWENGCWAYLEGCYETMSYYNENGYAIDGAGVDYDYDDEPAGVLPPLAIALVVALIIVIIVRKTLKGQLKSVAAGKSAQDYLVGDVKLTESNDVFMGTTITKTPIPKNDNDSGGSSVDFGGFGGSGGGKF